MVDRILILLVLVLFGIGLYVLHQIFPELINFQYITIGWAVEVPIAIILHLLTKDKPSSNDVQKIVTETLADRHKEMDDYTNHLKLDIVGILESNSYLEALFEERTHKQMIIQHMYTYQQVVGIPLYRNYRKISEVKNDVKKVSFDLMMMYYHLTDEIDTLCRDPKDLLGSKGSVNYSELLNTLGFEQNVNFHDDSFNLTKVNPINDFNITEFHFYIERDDEDRSKYYVKYEKTIIAESNSKKVIKKIQKAVLKHSLNMINLIRKLQRDNDSLKAVKIAFDEMMDHIAKSLEHGKPNFGVCDACMSFFPYQNRKLYNHYLMECNSNPFNWWGENVWRSK